MDDEFQMESIVRRLAEYASATDSDEPGKRAAVAAILRADRAGDAEVLLVRRAEHPNDPWSGHMALPGGRRDDIDATLADTAIRETREEVALDLAANGTLLARLPDLPAVVRGHRVNLVIAPFVFALRGAAEIALSDEIAEALWTPVGPLARGEGAGTFPYERDGEVYELPFLDVRGRRVWGLTYLMLQRLFAAVRGG